MDRSALTVGAFTMQVSSEHGALVAAVRRSSRPRARPRPSPPALMPRDFRGLIGREWELERALDAIAVREPFELHGDEGAGKTSVLRRLCHRAAQDRPAPDGVIHHRVAATPIRDVLQLVHDALHEPARDGEPRSLPTTVELREALAEREALVVLDDLDLPAGDLGELLDALPRCAVVRAGADPAFGEGRSLPLGGLRTDPALVLLERRLGRPLAGDERDTAARLVALVGGRPGALVQAAALALQQGRPLAAAELPEALVRASSPEQRRALGVLARLAPASVALEEVARIADIVDAGVVLADLLERGLAAAADGSRWVAALGGPTALPLSEPAHVVAGLVSDAAAWTVDDVPAISVAIDLAQAAGAVHDVIALARAADSLLSLGRRWGTWERALRAALDAARRTGDRRTEAWALHQLGTRAALLDGLAAGAALLKDAQRLREQLGDTDGAAATRQNLLRFGVREAGPWWWKVAAGVAVVAVAGVATAVVLAGDDPPSADVVTTPSGVTTVTGPTASGTSGTDGPGNGGTPALSAPSTQSFATSGDPVEQAVTATSSGDAPVTVTDVSTEGPFTAGATDCVREIAPGDSCTVAVTFTPTAAGAQTGALVFGGTTARVVLTGLARGVPPATEPPPETVP